MSRSGLALMLIVAGCVKLNSPVARHSSSVALSTDGSRLFVVNADADSVSVIDTKGRRLEREILLASAAPAPDSKGHYAAAVLPRALAYAPHADRLYVSGERATQVEVVDPTAGKVVARINVGSEPYGVLVSPDEESVYVACSQDDEVQKIDTATHKVVGTAHTASRKPWGLAWSNDGKTILVTHLLASGSPTTPGPAISVIDPGSMKVLHTWEIPDVGPRGDPKLAYGQARGLYDVAPRPGSDEVWIPHLMLANQTAQPTLDFETTVFPTLSVFKTSGALQATLSTDAQSVAGIDGAFGDIVSGPHGVAFTKDGKYAFVIDTNSEDVLVVDAEKRVEASLLRPLPGHMPEGIVLSPDGKTAYIDERNTADIAIVDIDSTMTPPALTVEPTVVSRFEKSDPMPAAMRRGQHLFFSANSDELPITQNHWIACGSCHVEGRSDAVTWQFVPGPRDTPSNAGGTLDTGFLLHTADRRVLQDYWHVINDEQGGNFSPTVPAQQADLNNLEAFLDFALPVPIPPHTDATLVAKGRQAFEKAGCTACHLGPALTDSGTGNPSLDLTGMILLHDVGTCNTSAYPDVVHPDDDGNTKAACQFDTPALRGLADSAPYFHDGSAATLKDVLEMTRGKMGDINALSADEENALVEYLRSL